MIIKDEMKKVKEKQDLAIKIINENGTKYVDYEKYKNRFRLLNFVPVVTLAITSIPFIVGGLTPLGLTLTTVGNVSVGVNYYIIRYNKLKREFKNKFNLEDVDLLYVQERDKYYKAVDDYSVQGRKLESLYEMERNGIVAANIQKDDGYDAIMDMYYDYIIEKNNRNNVKIRKLKK